MDMYLKLNLALFDGEYTGDATTSSDLSPTMKTYYNKRLLEAAKPNLVHDQFGKDEPIPQRGGKTQEWRRFASLPKNLDTITEGVTPNKKNMKEQAINVTVNQYGDWIESTDLLQMTALDPIIDERAVILGDQAGRSLDTVTREVINSGTNVIHADHIASDGTVTELTGPDDIRENLVEGCRLTLDMIFRAAAVLKTNNAPKFGTDYVAIIHPYSEYDVMSSDGWLDVTKYQASEKIFNGEIGKIGGVRFVESSEAKIFLPNEIIPGVRRMKVKTAVSSSTSSLVVEGEYENATFSTAVPVYIGGAANTITAISCTEGSGQSTLTLGTNVTTVAKGAVVCGKGAGKNGDAVFSTLVLGKEAYAKTEIEGGSLQMIVNPLGYGNDPLKQRSSCGWKATKAVAILDGLRMVRIESVNRYSQKVSDN